MATDDERREVAARLRGAETEAACFLLAGEMQVEAVDGDGEACEEWRAA